MIFRLSVWMWFILPSLMLNKIRILCSSNDKTDQPSSDEGFFQTLRMFKMIEKYPQLGKSGTCYAIKNISAIKTNENRFTIMLTVDLQISTNKKVQFCRNNTEDGANKSHSSSDGLQNSTDSHTVMRDNNDSILAVSQTIGIVICGLLLTIFFFIAGFMRIKNFMRRNKSTLKINGLRSCLTSEDETDKWGAPLRSNNNLEPTLSNYLQLQSAMDKSVSQFMIRPTHYAKANELESKKAAASVRRKSSMRTKTVPKKSTSQTAQRRYSLSNEIDSVMNKHFNMIGVARKSGYRSTQNIGGFLQQSVLSQGNMSQNSMINDQRYRNQTMNFLSDAAALNKSQPSRHFRNSNFPCRRATTIGGRSNSRHLTSLRYLDTSSPPVDAMYASQHSVVNTRSRNMLRKQLTLDESKESYDKYLSNSQINADNPTDDNGEQCYLKVPPKPSNLLSSKKCIFTITDEKASQSAESLGSNSRCSSFEKASSLWSSLEVQDSEALEKKSTNT